jgi:L-ribulose-5-phosphate 3-epimerase UlaE
MACHAKDSLITPNRMSAYLTQVPPGEGVNDYETYLVRLSRMQWPRTLLIEHLQDEQYPAAKAYIEETAARLGVKINGKE